jgi:NAD(P)-dependent dehydrogenase (short-subunit alcohol dehydrogenase family)
MPSVLITGANRGMGLEWARQYARQEWTVYATCRDPDAADDLMAIAAAHEGTTVQRLDVSDPDSVAALAQALAGWPIDVLVNNAGVYLEGFESVGIEALSYAHWAQTFAANTMGPVRVSAALLGSLGRSERGLVVAISSHMGSINEIGSPGSYFYRSSKAALNAAMKGVSLELRPKGIGVLLLHPGWVRTRMGGPHATITPEQSVQGMRRLVGRFDLSQTGRFLRYDGAELPW